MSSVSPVLRCDCTLTCSKTITKDSSLTYKDVYFYQASAESCEPLKSGCSLEKECLFDSFELCVSRCKEQESGLLGGCEATQFGCCPDQVTARNIDGSCQSKSSLVLPAVWWLVGNET